MKLQVCMELRTLRHSKVGCFGSVQHGLSNKKTHKTHGEAMNAPEEETEEFQDLLDTSMPLSTCSPLHMLDKREKDVCFFLCTKSIYTVYFVTYMVN